jgi:two-component system, sensor histidine kinase
VLGWVRTAALAMGGSNQSLFLLGALLMAQGTAAIPLLVAGLVLSLAAMPGWIELLLMWPDRVGGVAAVCGEAFRPYSAVLANLAGTCYCWGWVPTCGLTSLMAAEALHSWYLPGLPVTALAITLLLLFAILNFCGIRPVATTAVWSPAGRPRWRSCPWSFRCWPARSTGSRPPATRCGHPSPAGSAR